MKREGYGRVVRSTRTVVDSDGGVHKGRKCTVLMDVRHGSSRMRGYVRHLKSRQAQDGFVVTDIQSVGDRLTLEISGADETVATIIEICGKWNLLIEVWFPTSTNVPRPFALTQCPGSGAEKKRTTLPHVREALKQLDKVDKEAVEVKARDRRMQWYYED